MLSKRLGMILDLIEPCNILVDIGSDHGYLALEALRSEKVKQVIASDLRPGPLNQTQKTFAQANVFEKGRTILSDGLRSIEVQPDCAVLAGMGADLIVQIIQQDLEKFKNINQIITQANTKHSILRSKLAQLGFSIQQERIIEDGFFYIAQSYKYLGLYEELSEKQIYFGQRLNILDPIYLAYLKNEQERLNQILFSHPNSNHHRHLLSLIKKYLD